jgi:hypothetical protein
MLLKRLTAMTGAMLLIVSTVASAATSNTRQTAQTASPVVGKYEGVAKGQAVGEIAITVELKEVGGKLSGSIDTPQGALPITSANFADGKLTLKFDAGGNEGTVTAQIAGDKIVGNWEMGGETGTIELKRVVAATTAPSPAPAASPAAAAADPVTGDWDGSADVQGTEFPFTLKLKLEGGNVSGTTESAQGSMALSGGKFAGDKLSFTLETPQGVITFTATVKEGKADGEYDFAGQMKGKWQAKKK